MTISSQGAAVFEAIGKSNQKVKQKVKKSLNIPCSSLVSYSSRQDRLSAFQMIVYLALGQYYQKTNQRVSLSLPIVNVSMFIHKLQSQAVSRFTLLIWCLCFFKKERQGSLPVSSSSLCTHSSVYSTESNF